MIIRIPIVKMNFRRSAKTRRVAKGEYQRYTHYARIIRVHRVRSRLLAHSREATVPRDYTSTYARGSLVRTMKTKQLARPLQQPGVYNRKRMWREIKTKVG